MTITTLPILVQEEDVGLFYQLANMYHTDKQFFKQCVEKMARGNDEFHETGSKVSHEDSQGKFTAECKQATEDSESLFTYVSKNCTCGTCYKTFAAPSRLPWRGDGEGNFFSARHPPIKISGCPVSSYKGSGYIWISHSELEHVRKGEKANMNLAKELRNQALEERKAAVKLSQEVEKLEISKVQTQEALVKVTRAKQQNRASKVADTNKLMAQKAKLEKDLDDINLEYQMKEDEIKQDKSFEAHNHWRTLSVEQQCRYAKINQHFTNRYAGQGSYGNEENEDKVYNAFIREYNRSYAHPGNPVKPKQERIIKQLQTVNKQLDSIERGENRSTSKSNAIRLRD